MRNLQWDEEIDEHDLAYHQIHSFFDAFTLRVSLAYTESILQSAVRTEFWNYRAPANLLHFRRELGKLIGAGFFLQDVLEDEEATRDIPENGLPDLSKSEDFIRPSPGASIWYSIPRNLSVSAYHNPFKAIRRFCQLRSEPEWMFTLDNLTEYALANTSYTEAFPEEDLFLIRKELCCLIEASHLIEVRKNWEGPLELE
ncbi:MAG: hypothetical protein KGM98_00520 [Bacteroidota bacterium]|nr:hypothetical protein [Bacteroidota bacterium]